MSIAKTSIAFAFLAAAASLPALLGAALDAGHAPAAPGIEAPAPGPSQDATPQPAQDRTNDNDGHRRRRAAPPLPEEAWPYGEDGDAIPV